MKNRAIPSWHNPGIGYYLPFHTTSYSPMRHSNITSVWQHSLFTYDVIYEKYLYFWAASSVLGILITNCNSKGGDLRGICLCVSVSCLSERIVKFCTHLHLCIVHMHTNNLNSILIIHYLVAIFVSFCNIYVKTFWNIWDRNLKIYTHVHHCTVHMHANHLGNISGTHYLATEIVLQIGTPLGPIVSSRAPLHMGRQRN